MRPLAYSNAKNGTKCQDYFAEFSYAVFWGFFTQLNFKTMKTITSFPRKVKETPNIFIKLKDGTQLAARVWMPVDAEKNPVPAILEYLPYRKRDGTIVRDALTHPYFAGHGYASIRVDMRGNGDSDGLMHDEYTEQELFGPNPTSPYTPLSEQEIDSITVLQQEKAITIYGQKGKKGVVIISTKNGKPAAKKRQ